MNMLKFAPRTPHPASGLYHYRREDGDEKSRVHLRLDADGHGTLIVNANRVMHLNPTAALMAYLILEEVDEEQAVRTIQQKYRVSNAQARADYSSFILHLSSLFTGACPIHELELEVDAPFSARPSAPYRMDLALTYRCNNDCAHCYNQRISDSADQRISHSQLLTPISPHAPRELSTAEWQRILDKAWSLGIPHIIFTGGEPTLRDDLPELIAHAESNGQITGLNTNARRLSDPRYVERLIEAGLDHVQITLESHDPEIHDRMVRAKGAFPQTVKGIRNVLASPLYVMTNTTMLRDNASTLPATLDFLAELGVPTVGLNALIYSGRGATVGTGLAESELYPLLETARARTEARGQRLIWYTPTQYCGFDPMSLDLGVKGCTAALYNMCVEQDGGVLPCQSYYHQLGNLLTDEWDAIWNHELAIRLRERKGLPEKCSGCLLLAECGGGCPLQFEEIYRSIGPAESSPARSREPEKCE
ncbi:MAG: PqqD family peptide modification chaperone [Chloroflexi bacterium]|nr:PqqD family peptide modification chaperone [Chloroflexota bacterium]